MEQTQRFIDGLQREYYSCRIVALFFHYLDRCPPPPNEHDARFKHNYIFYCTSGESIKIFIVYGRRIDALDGHLLFHCYAYDCDEKNVKKNWNFNRFWLGNSKVIAFLKNTWQPHFTSVRNHKVLYYRWFRWFKKIVPTQVVKCSMLKDVRSVCEPIVLYRR